MLIKTLPLLSLSALLMPSHALSSEIESSLSMGYVQSNFTFIKDNDASGVNVKYLVEPQGQPVGFGGSVTYTSGKNTSRNSNGTTSRHEISYLSIGIGPSYRLNDYLTTYAMVGGVSASSKIEQGRSSHDLTLSYGAGIQVSAWRSMFVDLYYERVGVGRGEKYMNGGSYTIGAGYRF